MAISQITWLLVHITKEGGYPTLFDITPMGCLLVLTLCPIGFSGVGRGEMGVTAERNHLTSGGCGIQQK